MLGGARGCRLNKRGRALGDLRGRSQRRRRRHNGLGGRRGPRWRRAQAIAELNKLRETLGQDGLGLFLGDVGVCDDAADALAEGDLEIGAWRAELRYLASALSNGKRTITITEAH